MARIITDDNWRDFLRPEYRVPERIIAYGSRDAYDHGLRPFGDSQIELIPWDQMEERVAEATAKRMMPMDFLEDAGHQPHNQGRTNYCWAYGLAMAMEAQRLMQALPYRRLAGASLGWVVGWRNQGNYLSSAIKGAIERGIASSDFVPDGTTDYRRFEDGWEADAKQNRPVEFTDLDASSEDLMAQQCLSVLLQGDPIYLAHNWWSHALTCMGVIWDTRHKWNVRWVHWNSHGDGRIELTGSKGVPDEAYVPRLVTVS